MVRQKIIMMGFHNLNDLNCFQAVPTFFIPNLTPVANELVSNILKKKLSNKYREKFLGYLSSKNLFGST